MIKYIRENKQWLVSGIGVTILLGLISFVSWLWHTDQKLTAVPPSSQAGQTSTAPSMIPAAPLSDQKVTPDSIMKEIDSARPLQRDDIARAFVGIPVEWDLVFVAADRLDDNRIALFFASSSTTPEPLVCMCDPNSPTEQVSFADPERSSACQRNYREFHFKKHTAQRCRGNAAMNPQANPRG